MSWNMIAEHRSPYCALECGDPIEVGQAITKTEDGWAHLDCKRRAVRPVKVCPKCHLTKPCDCEDAA